MSSRAPPGGPSALSEGGQRAVNLSDSPHCEAHISICNTMICEHNCGSETYPMFNVQHELYTHMGRPQHSRLSKQQSLCASGKQLCRQNSVLCMQAAIILRKLLCCTSALSHLFVNMSSKPDATVDVCQANHTLNLLSYGSKFS